MIGAIECPDPEPIRLHALLRYDRAERASEEAEAASSAAQKAAREAYDEMSEAYDALTRAEEEALDEALAVIRFEALAAINAITGEDA